MASPDEMEAAHILSRSYKRTRLLPEAGVCLCKSCHVWTHDHPAEAKAFFIETIGQAAYDRLWMLARA